MVLSPTCISTSLASRRSEPRSSRAVSVSPSNTIWNGPMPISAPCSSRALPVSSSPLSRVPLREPRSTSSTTPPSWRRSSAWKRETLGSVSTTPFFESRPSVSRLPSKSTVCTPTTACSREAMRVSSPERKRMSWSPISIASPGSSIRADLPSFSPLTKVPCRESRSATANPPSRAKTRAWWREARSSANDEGVVLGPAERRVFIQRQPPAVEQERGDSGGDLHGSTLTRAGLICQPDMGGEPTPGSLFGDYRVEELIGRGGMGSVLRATRESDGAQVALKLVLGERAGEVSFQNRFEREGRLAASFDHPNLVRVLEVGSHDGTPFIAMAYVDGVDLEGVLAGSGALHPVTAARVISEVGAGLDELHAAGLVHRDVKPGNVLIERGGRTPAQRLRAVQARGLGERADQDRAVDRHHGLRRSRAGAGRPRRARTPTCTGWGACSSSC